MIRVKKENHRSWFMSNYYPCEFVMNGIRYNPCAGKAHSVRGGMKGALEISRNS